MIWRDVWMSYIKYTLDPQQAQSNSKTVALVLFCVNEALDLRLLFHSVRGFGLAVVCLIGGRSILCIVFNLPLTAPKHFPQIQLQCCIDIGIVLILCILCMFWDFQHLEIFISQPCALQGLYCFAFFINSVCFCWHSLIFLWWSHHCKFILNMYSKCKVVKITETSMVSGCSFSYHFCHFKSHELTLIYFTLITSKINSMDPSVQISFIQYTGSYIQYVQ